MTVIKITVIHSTDYDQITMGIETLRNIVIITTDIFAVCTLHVRNLDDYFPRSRAVLLLLTPVFPRCIFWPL